MYKNEGMVEKTNRMIAESRAFLEGLDGESVRLQVQRSAQLINESESALRLLALIHPYPLPEPDR